MGQYIRAISKMGRSTEKGILFKTGTKENTYSTKVFSIKENLMGRGY
jgi:hypothetical protein